MEPLGRARRSCRTQCSPRAVRRPSGAPAPALTLSYLPGSSLPSWPLAVVLLCWDTTHPSSRTSIHSHTPKGSPVPCPQPANQITATWPCSRSPQPACNSLIAPLLVWGSWGTMTGSPLHPGCITFRLLSVYGRNDLTRDCSNGRRKLRLPLPSAPHLLQ